jgi:hypothetical protein
MKGRSTTVKNLLARGYFKTQQSTLPSEHPDLHCEIQFWRSIIDRAIRDLMTPAFSASALEFFDLEDPWFQQVCAFAFLPEEEVMRMADKVQNISEYELNLTVLLGDVNP